MIVNEYKIWLANLKYKKLFIKILNSKIKNFIVIFKENISMQNKVEI